MSRTSLIPARLSHPFALRGSPPRREGTPSAVCHRDGTAASRQNPLNYLFYKYIYRSRIIRRLPCAGTPLHIRLPRKHTGLFDEVSDRG